MASVNMTTKGEREVWYTAAETAQLVRTALKAAFPGVKFSVRSKTYSGGASIDVSWTDGPNRESVEHVIHPFEGATFDSSTDCKSYVRRIVNGQRVHYGADFIHANRDLGADYLRAVAERVARYYGLPAPEVKVTRGGSAYIDRFGPNSPVVDEHAPWNERTLGDVILQRAWETAAPR